MEVPYYEPHGNGEDLTGHLMLMPDGSFRFKEDYLQRTMRQRHKAQKGEPLDCGLVRMTLVRVEEGDL